MIITEAEEDGTIISLRKENWNRKGEFYVTVDDGIEATAVSTRLFDEFLEKYKEWKEKQCG